MLEIQMLLKSYIFISSGDITIILFLLEFREMKISLSIFHIFLISMSDSRRKSQSSCSTKDGENCLTNIYILVITTHCYLLRMITPFWKCNKGKYFGLCSIRVLCSEPKRILNYSGNLQEKK